MGRVVVIGATGHIGSYLVPRLIRPAGDRLADRQSPPHVGIEVAGRDDHVLAVAGARLVLGHRHTGSALSVSAC